MDYMTESLSNISGISLHWSSDCNMACKYCYIEKDKKCMAAYNRNIRKSLEDGSFVENMKRVFAPIKDQIESLSLWGAEPTINGVYFQKTIYELLDYFPQAHDFMFSTNALIGGERIYNDFFIPLYNYSKEFGRKIEFNLQLSLDGPPEFNDDSRHKGAAASTIATLETFLTRMPEDMGDLSLKINTKPTLDISYMRLMNERGLESFQWYYSFFNDLQEKADQWCNNNPNVSVRVAGMPTLVDPGYYTVEDGKTFAQWLENLCLVDKSKLPCYKNSPLFFQLFGTLDIVMDYYLSGKNILSIQENAFSCSASKNNITVDHEGKLYTCNRLCRNSALDDEKINKHSMRSNTNINCSDKQWLKRTWGSNAFHFDLVSRRAFLDQLALPMALSGQIDKKYAYSEEDRTLMFWLICALYCHIGAEEDYTQNPSIIPATYLRLLGNGAIDALFKYYRIEAARGGMPTWNTAMLT